MKKEMTFVLDESTQCMECTSHSLDKDGYADVERTIDGIHLRRAHRIMYFLHYGQIPKGSVIRHMCDNKTCCNPMHLLVGTQKENMNDKGRNR